MTRLSLRLALVRRLAAFRVFVSTETGAVTVDWVVLTGAMLGLGLTAAVAVRTGVISLGSEIETTLTNARVAAPGWSGGSDPAAVIAGFMPGCPGGDAGLVALATAWHALMPGAYASVADITASHMDWVDHASDAQVMSYLDSFRPMVAAGMSPSELSYDEILPWAKAECVAMRRGLV